MLVIKKFLLLITLNNMLEIHRHLFKQFMAQIYITNDYNGNTLGNTLRGEVIPV